MATDEMGKIANNYKYTHMQNNNNNLMSKAKNTSNSNNHDWFAPYQNHAFHDRFKNNDFVHWHDQENSHTNDDLSMQCNNQYNGKDEIEDDDIFPNWDDIACDDLFQSYSGNKNNEKENQGDYSNKKSNEALFKPNV